MTTKRGKKSCDGVMGMGVARHGRDEDPPRECLSLDPVRLERGRTLRESSEESVGHRVLLEFLELSYSIGICPKSMP